MKIKILFINLTAILLILALIQVVLSSIQIGNIPPYAKNIASIYKSGYFKELDFGFKTITTSFLEIKQKVDAIAAWDYLRTIKEKNNIQVNIFNTNGWNVTAPGITLNRKNKKIFNILNSGNPSIITSIKGGKYKAIIPLKGESQCFICHRKKNYKSTYIGALSFSRTYDSYIYFSSEKMIIFFIFSIFLSVILFYLIKWDPEKNIKELFDK